MHPHDIKWKYYEYFFDDLKQMIKILSNFYQKDNANNKIDVFLNFHLLKSHLISIDNDFYQVLYHGFLKVFGPENCANLHAQNIAMTKFLNRFCMIFYFLMFWNSQKQNIVLTDLCFLLRWKHLSNSGFELLSNIGLTPSLNTVNKLISNLSEKVKTKTLLLLNRNSTIFWADNFVRKILLKKFANEKFIVNYTVFAAIPFTNIIIDDHINLNNGISSINHYPVATVDGFFHYDISTQVNELLEIFESTFNYFYIFNFKYEYPFITIPIKATNHKLNVIALDVHDIPSASVHGMCNIMNFFGMLSNIRTDNNFHYFILDYDLYWKYYRIIFSTPLWKTMKQRAFISLGNWHICYKLSSAIWEAFSEIFLQDIYKNAFGTTSNQVPSYPEQLKVYLWILSRTNAINTIIKTILTQKFELKSFKSYIHILINVCIPILIRLNLALVNNEPLLFYNTLLPVVSLIFCWLNKHNYTNATLLMLHQFKYLQSINHPILVVLYSNFHCFNEELPEATNKVLSSDIHKGRSFDSQLLAHQYILLNYYSELCQRIKLFPSKNNLQPKPYSPATSIPITNPSKESEIALNSFLFKIAHYSSYLELPYISFNGKQKFLTPENIHPIVQSFDNAKSKLSKVASQLKDKLTRDRKNADYYQYDSFW